MCVYFFVLWVCCSLLSKFSLVERVEATCYPYRLPFPAEINGNKCNLAGLLVEVASLVGISSKGISSNDMTNEEPTSQLDSSIP